MRIALIVSVLVAAPVAVAAPKAARTPSLAKPVCQDNRLRDARTAPAPRVHPLDQEPPADMIQTVLRTVDGCTKPVVVRADVGRPARR